jgi:hypothetical protein
VSVYTCACVRACVRVCVCVCVRVRACVRACVQLERYTIVPDYALNVSSLQSIDLSFNNITWVSDFAFAGNSSTLQTVNLSNNKITALSDQSFTGATALAMVDMSNNSITFLSIGVCPYLCAPSPRHPHTVLHAGASMRGLCTVTGLRENETIARCARRRLHPYTFLSSRRLHPYTFLSSRHLHPYTFLSSRRLHPYTFLSSRHLHQRSLHAHSTGMGMSRHLLIFDCRRWTFNRWAPT